MPVEQAWATAAPWPEPQWSFAPLGYRPAVHGEQGTAMVPTYAPGLPLLMAVARLVAGPCAVFWIVPIAGAVLVLATFGLGRALGSPGTGLAGAALVLASPVFLFMLMSPMTDVPVAAAWAVAGWLLIGSRGSGAGPPGRAATVRALAAGLASAIAILIRPNLVLGAAALALWFPLRAWRDGPGARPRHLLNALVFGAIASAGALAVAVINDRLYGSPLVSGYGSAGSLFDLANVWANLRTYCGWFVESQTAWPLAGLAAFLFPRRTCWPGTADRTGVVVLLALGAAVTGSYLVYGVYDAWWYLRFLLPVWPMVMLGFGAVALLVARTGRPAAAIVAVLVVWLGLRGVVFARDHNAFRLWKEERRYATVGRLVRAATPPDSVILAIQHSGSLRRYAGRMTIRFDSLDGAWLDRAIGWLADRGIAAYLVVEDWEEPRFRAHFRGQEAATRADGAPVLTYTGPATVRLYDLRALRDPLAAVTAIAETWDGPRCPAAVPLDQPFR